MTCKPGSPLKCCFFIFDSSSLEIPSILSFTQIKKFTFYHFHKYEKPLSRRDEQVMPQAPSVMCQGIKMASRTTHIHRNKAIPLFSHEEFITFPVD